MELQVVNKEIAIKLKQIGFNWKVNKYWIINSHDKHFNSTDLPSEYVTSDYFGDNILYDFNQIDIGIKPYNGFYSAPTLALAIKYFRDIHKLYISVDEMLDDIRCSITHNNILYYVGTSYPIFEDGEIAGILKAFEILQGVDLVNEKYINLNNI